MVYEFLTIIFFSLCIQLSHEQITFNQTAQLREDVHGNSYQFMYVGESKLANVTGRLVVADPIYACNWEKIKNKDDFENNIVLVRRGHCSPADKFRTVQKGSGRAIVILVEKDEYLHLAGSYFLHTKGITIPGYEYRPGKQSTYDQLVKLEGAPNTTIEVEIDGESPIIDQTYYLAFSIVQGTFSLVNVFLAYRKIKQLYKAQEINRTLPQITLAIEILTNILRVILCLEPEYGLGRGLIEFGTLGFLQSGTLPWSLVPTLIIAFYWDNAIENWEKYMKKSWKVLPFKRCKFPLVGISSLIVFGDLVSGVIRAMYYGNKWMAGIILYLSAAVVLIIAIIFTLNGARALYFMWAKCEEANPRHTQAIRRMTSFVFGNCCGIYIVVVFLLVMPPPIEHGWKIGYFGAAFALNFVSLMQIMVFDPETIFQLDVMEKENETAKCTPSASIELQNTTTSNNAINV